MPRARPQAELYVAFLEATLAMLEGEEGRGTAPPSYQPAPVELWRVPDALGLILQRLQGQPDGLPLAHCLPEVPPMAADRPLRLRRRWPAPWSPAWNWPARERWSLTRRVPLGRSY